MSDAQFRMALYRRAHDRTVSRTDIQDAWIELYGHEYAGGTNDEDWDWSDDSLLEWFCDDILPDLLKQVKSFGLTVDG